MRTLPCMECKQLECNCFETKPRFRYNEEGRDHHGGLKEFIAWDGEGIRVDDPLFTVNIGGVPCYSDNLSATDKSKVTWHWEQWPDGIPTKVFDRESVPERLMLWEYAPDPQPYVLLANSKGDSIISDKNGLRTADCFELMLKTKQRYPNSIFVGFGFNYDINQILRDLPEERLWQIHDDNWTVWRGYWIKWLPGKSLTVAQRITRRSFVVYDVFGFFQSSFLDACHKYLGDDPDLLLIEKGKAARDAFDYKDLDTFIKPYNTLECSLLVKMMNILRNDLHSVGIFPGLWHGPGAIANVVLKNWSIPISRSVPKEVLDASQRAYAGGRFEHFWLGRYTDTVYQYDIRSAYPAGATYLPDLSRGSWENVKTFEPGSFGVWSINYCSGQERKGIRPEPLFCRSETGLISYPCQVRGWYWTPEAELCPDSVEEGWVFRPDEAGQPFAFIKELYEARRVFKSEKNSAERALKLILNSIYGKLAQTVGWNKETNSPPRWHQLEYAGYITSYTRAKIYRAVLLDPDAIIAIETDAVFSARPLDLPLSEELGDWELTEYAGITYLQSGYYYALKHDGSIVCKYRGMDRDRETKQPIGLPYRTVLDHLHNCGGQTDKATPPLYSTSTRFVGLGLGLRTAATWRAWEKIQRCISLDQRSRESKRVHVAGVCRQCIYGLNMHDHPHRMLISGHQGYSYATPLPWREHPDAIPSDAVEWIDYTGDLAQWQIIR